MAARSYHEHCGLAHALELVGERWALLVVRELLPGPKRFTDLATGLPRIPSNVLSGRLKELEQAGVVARRVLPRPSGAVVYELTDHGRELDAIVVQLARWGVRTLGEPREDDSVSAASFMLGLRSLFVPEAAGDLRATFEVRFDETVVTARVADGALEVAEGPAEHADLVIHADLSLRAVFAGGTSDTIRVEGDEALFERFVELFRAI
ncbi:winged helix-turn-helix transcriptional regulator [Solirubrobacter soli]|uniref:winged helix-turn-helix transcriptional regulator n=1 Tax=Solirubrobacter soli TaxID=363832 RepID=UPI000403F39D|nr:helix-turn-helix domain-containing protein [Solirubrobacter soli]